MADPETTLRGSLAEVMAVQFTDWRDVDAADLPMLLSGSSA